MHKFLQWGAKTFVDGLSKIDLFGEPYDRPMSGACIEGIINNAKMAFNARGRVPAHIIFRSSGGPASGPATGFVLAGVDAFMRDEQTKLLLRTIVERYIERASVDEIVFVCEVWLRPDVGKDSIEEHRDLVDRNGGTFEGLPGTEESIIVHIERRNDIAHRTWKIPIMRNDGIALTDDAVKYEMADVKGVFFGWFDDAQRFVVPQ